MFSKMLKLTTVLLVLMAFFVVPAGVLYSEEIVETIHNDLLCEGVFVKDDTIKCKKVVTNDGTECMFTEIDIVIIESKGCTLKSTGNTCYEWKKTHYYGKIKCKLVLLDNGTYNCDPDLKDANSKQFKYCRDTLMDGDSSN